MLSLVATPIGNLKDVTQRALDTLAAADVIACEDTRVTLKLLNAYGIRKPLISVHEHATERKIAEVIAMLKDGKNIAYASDAGTPGVNDPGGKLVEAALKEGIPVEPIPGASALTAAISVCGFPMHDFTYVGFIPHKKGKQTELKAIADRSGATVFFESSHRILKTLEAFKEIVDAKRLLFVGRELTKMHETLYRGTIDEVLERLHTTSLKGEFVVIVAPAGFS
jgi:16S rRNA (cytidine1402-2'-O)-methyltransferase